MKVNPMNQVENQTEVRRVRDLRGHLADFAGSRINLFCTDIERAAETVVCAIEHESDGMISGTGMHGWIGDKPSRPATDAECCFWNCSIGVDGRFDAREALPEQVAAWLRETASELMDAAERIANIEDDRDLALMRRYVAGDQGIIFDHESATFAELDAA